MSNLYHLPTHYGPARNPDKRTKATRALHQRPQASVRFLAPRPAPVQTDKQRARELYDEARADDRDDRDPAWGATLYQAAIKLDPSLALAHTNLGNCYYRLHRYQDAMACYRQALELDPLQPEAAYNAGYLELEADREHIAIPLFKQAIQLDPSFADAYFNLAMALEKSMGPDALPVQHAWRKYLQLTTDAKDSAWREIAKRHLIKNHDMSNSTCQSQR